MERHSIAIWFFIGALLLLYGALIFATGIWELSHPQQNPVVLSDLHFAIWWGAGLILLGLFYSLRYAPEWTKRRSPEQSE